MNSSARAPRRAIGTPDAANSSFRQPSPSPRSSRPLERMSTVVACLATRAGEANGMFSSATPSRIRDVWAATYPSVTMGSRAARYTGDHVWSPSGGYSSRWNVHAVA